MPDLRPRLVRKKMAETESIPTPGDEELIPWFSVNSLIT